MNTLTNWTTVINGVFDGLVSEETLYAFYFVFNYDNSTAFNDAHIAENVELYKDVFTFTYTDKPLVIDARAYQRIEQSKQPQPKYYPRVNLTSFPDLVSRVEPPLCGNDTNSGNDWFRV